MLSIVEAVLLAIVALLAAYTGYASARWGTEASVHLATASAARTQANRAALDAQDTKNFDSTTFNTWFTAYVAGNAQAEAGGRAPVPSRLHGGVRRLAGHRSVHQPVGPTGADLHAAVQAAGVGDR